MTEVQTPPPDPKVEIKAPEPPAWMAEVPEKLKRATPEETAAAVIQSYKALEKAKAQPPAPEPKPALAIDTTATIESVDEIITSAGLDVAAVAKTFSETGKLDDAAYAAFAAKGFGRAVVDQFIEGQQAIQNKAQASLQAAVTEAGGQDKLNALLGWAKTGIDKTEHADFNRRLNDPALRVGAIRDLKARAAVASGTSGSKPLVNGQLPGSGKPTQAQINEARAKYHRGELSVTEMAKVYAASRGA